MRLRHVRQACAWSLLLVLLAAAPPVRAADDIVVHSASAELHDDSIVFTVRAEYVADEEMRDALNTGAIVEFDLQAKIHKLRQYWFDEQVLEASLRRELTWNALSQRFVLKNVADNQQQTFATLEEALQAAGVADGWVVDVGSSLDDDATYQISVRARLRLGRLPNALRALTFWTRYWNRSEYYTWPLAR